MNTTSKITLRTALGLLVGLWLAIPTALAEPYIAVRTGQPCAACHVNPSGGGLRSSYGFYYGTRELPARPGAEDMLGGGQMTESLRLGSDLRFNLSRIDYDQGEAVSDAQGFDTHSGQVYVALQPKDSRFTLYLDQQLLPGGSRNREAFIMAQLGENHTVKAGNLILPYGLRLEDDSAFVRQASGINFNNSDQGVELGLNYDQWRFDVALSNGSFSQRNEDRDFQYLFRGEYLADPWRAGASYVINNAEAGRREMSSLFGGVNFKGYILLFEFGRIEDESITNLPGTNQTQEVSLIELNREVIPGYNVKLTTEWLDPDTAIDENDRTRHSALLEFTPYAGIQIRGGFRVGEDIPQREVGNFVRAFVQLHWYY